ncbi:glutamate racemase [Roseateles aquatilis]|uniref:Glutamate racemase n=1 Tax=Roseateles aquatilis TaxID=431061 RepID=A0A246JL39_9BURK|nr:glutamate racemase [Roseateles aquatilis]OWQ93327.1 glutamate racemase [Roseateles aquatilis]
MTSPSLLPASSALHVPCIGVFDSGVGGLTVLKALREQLPDVPLHYLADAAHAPYGDRSSAYIVERSVRVAEHLHALGARMAVVACNTATVHAVQAMRERWPAWPVVGTEPGVKPAVAATRTGRIGVMATTATIASRRYEQLVAAHATDVTLISQPCPGLVTLIEQGDLRSAELDRLIERYCAPLREAEVDTVLLGCTHYPLVQARIQAALGDGVRLLNIEDAVARQAKRIWDGLGIAPEGSASIVLESTGDPAPLQVLAREALGWRDAVATRVAT